MDVRLKDVSSLSSDDREAWAAFQAADPALASPYFALGFLDAVAAARSDVRVVCAYEAGAPVGFLPLHTGPLGHARPLGGPLGDHHGLIAARGARLDIDALLAAAKVPVFDFFGAVAEAGFQDREGVRDGSWVVDLGGGYDAYLARQKKPGGNTFRTIMAANRKLEEAGEVVFRFDDRRPETLEALLEWKSGQYHASGHFDVFSVEWTRKLIHHLSASENPGARALVSSVELNGALVAAHFGLLGERALHYWFPAYDPDFARLAPGNALLSRLLEALAGEGIAEVHLGPGEYRYKAALGSWQFALVQGCAGQGPVAAARRAAAALEAAAERLPIGRAAHWPGKAFRRIDTLMGFRAA
ncbi:MAG: GNAT family N-acetyltransferase [Oceanicaulis sp.]